MLPALPAKLTHQPGLSVHVWFLTDSVTSAVCVWSVAKLPWSLSARVSQSSQGTTAQHVLQLTLTLPCHSSPHPSLLGAPGGASQGRYEDMITPIRCVQMQGRGVKRERPWKQDWETLVWTMTLTRAEEPHYVKGQYGCSVQSNPGAHVIQRHSQDHDLVGQIIQVCYCLADFQTCNHACPLAGKISQPWSRCF